MKSLMHVYIVSLRSGADKHIRARHSEEAFLEDMALMFREGYKVVAKFEIPPNLYEKAWTHCQEYLHGKLSFPGLEDRIDELTRNSE